MVNLLVAHLVCLARRHEDIACPFVPQILSHLSRLIRMEPS